LQDMSRIKRTSAIIAIVAVALVASTVAVNHYYPIFQSSSQKIKVLATFYPVYDYTRNIAGDKADVSLLVPMTVDVHDFEPTPSSIQAVSTANLLIYSGAGLEPWILQIVAAANNPHLIQVDSSHGVSLIQVPPQFQKDSRAIDPHIWLDPVLAKKQVDNIVQGLVKADPADQAYFTANAKTYQAKLDYLNSEMVNATKTIATNKFVPFHVAFGYFAQEYGLNQTAVFGPFEDSPSAQDIQNIETVINQEKLCYVGFESLENTSVPDQIAAATHARPILMDPIEGLSVHDQTVGKTYLIKLQDDINNILTALNHVGC
jgi:zinc transport system substrate-binding protein